MAVYVDTHHIRWRHLYVMPLASTFLDEETMDGCIRKAVEFPSGEGIWRNGKETGWGFTIK
jgi:hypothetical protein